MWSMQSPMPWRSRSLPSLHRKASSPPTPEPISARSLPITFYTPPGGFLVSWSCFCLPSVFLFSLWHIHSIQSSLGDEADIHLDSERPKENTRDFWESKEAAASLVKVIPSRVSIRFPMGNKWYRLWGSFLWGSNVSWAQSHRHCYSPRAVSRLPNIACSSQQESREKSDFPTTLHSRTYWT